MTERLLIVRHAESEYTTRSLLNGDPTKPNPLSEYGREQARGLGERLRDVDIDLCFVTAFERTRETAELVLAGRDVLVESEPLLNDPLLGTFEGTDYDAHDRWMDENDWYAKPPGGESQLEALDRYIEGYRRVCDADARTVLLIAHHFPISFGLTIAWDPPPKIRRRYTRKIAPAELNEVPAEALRTGVSESRAELAPLLIP